MIRCMKFTWKPVFHFANETTFTQDRKLVQLETSRPSGWKLSSGAVYTAIFISTCGPNHPSFVFRQYRIFEFISGLMEPFVFMQKDISCNIDCIENVLAKYENTNNGQMVLRVSGPTMHHSSRLTTQSKSWKWKEFIFLVCWFACVWMNENHENCLIFHWS